MVDAIEQLAIEAMVLAAEADGALDDLEDELFRFGRVVAGQPDLRAALADPSLPAERKQALLSALLDGKVTPVTLRLIRDRRERPGDGEATMREHRARANLAGELEGRLLCREEAPEQHPRLLRHGERSPLLVIA